MTTIDLRSRRAARREASENPEPTLVLDDGEPILLPAELPVDALAPFADLELDRSIGVLFQTRNLEDGERIVRDLLTVKPTLATDLVAAAHASLERLLCAHVPAEAEQGCDLDEHRHAPECPWARFVAFRPSPQDVGELVAGIWRTYGADLGKALGRFGSRSTGSTTSKGTSPGSTRSSTRGTSSRSPAPVG